MKIVLKVKVVPTISGKHCSVDIGEKIAKRLQRSIGSVRIVKSVVEVGESNIGSAERGVSLREVAITQGDKLLARRCWERKGFKAVCRCVSEAGLVRRRVTTHPAVMHRRLKNWKRNRRN